MHKGPFVCVQYRGNDLRQFSAWASMVRSWDSGRISQTLLERAWR